ncbi:CBBY-like protein [Pyrus communis]|uniref:CBBY-like protein n=1 Tax=Pyrus communis TaxID=23211 RepID=UPI0035BFF553
MDSASRSILRAQPFSSTAAIFLSSNNTTARFLALPKNNRNPNLVRPFSSTFPRNSTLPGKCLHFDRFAAFSSLSGAKDQNPSQELAVLLEVDGVLMDAYQLGNCESFNAAFKKVGLGYEYWTEPLYLGLLRTSAGDEEKMLNLYFNAIGWPSSLQPSQVDLFVKNVLQKKKIAMDEFLMSESLTLRPGVEEFIDGAYKEGIPVVVLTTYSKSENHIARSIVEKLGEERVSKLKIVDDDEVLQSLYNQLVNDTGFSSRMDEQQAKEAIKAVSADKQRIAKEVALMLKLTLDINTCRSESLEKIILALRAGAEVAGLPVCDCVLISGSQYGVAGAERVGMPCVVLRSSLTARAEFPWANGIMDGFGGADLTIPKLLNKRWS